MTREVRFLLLALTALIPAGWVPAVANPLDPQAAAGTVSLAGEGTANLTVNQSTDKAIINWRTFDIGNGEATTFVQPGVNSVTLNRVTGGLGTSTIDGALSANGNILLINPDGILFGPQSIVDVGGLLATTSNLADDDFMASRYVFNQAGDASASVVNAGTITAANSGFAALVAPGVRNAGTIAARLGNIGLASGNAFTLDFYGDRLLTLAVDDETAGSVRDVQTGETLDALVKNEGTLKADGGTVQLTAAAAREVVDAVINNEGVIEANSVGLQNGKIVLGAAAASSKPAGAPVQKVKVSGTLSASGKASGETGGYIEITGEAIELAGTTIDASGYAGGGSVRVGGDAGGRHANPDIIPFPRLRPETALIPTATTLVMDDASLIGASATTDGGGGDVVLWSDGTTHASGTIVARGGDQAGDGGFIEVSGIGLLDFAGLRPDILAPQGSGGTVLYDPPYTLAITSSNVSSLTDVLNQGGTAIVLGAFEGFVSIQANILKTTSGAATLKIFGDNGIEILSGVVIGSTSGPLDVLLDADADFNISHQFPEEVRLVSSSTARYTYANFDEDDPDYSPTLLGGPGHNDYMRDLTDLFYEYIVNGDASGLSELTTSLMGQDPVSVWGDSLALDPFFGQDSTRADSVISPMSNVKFYLAGGSLTAFENEYTIVSDTRVITSGFVSDLLDLAESVKATGPDVIWAYAIGDLTQPDPFVDVFYVVTEIERIPASLVGASVSSGRVPAAPADISGAVQIKILSSTSYWPGDQLLSDPLFPNISPPTFEIPTLDSFNSAFQDWIAAKVPSVNPPLATDPAVAESFELIANARIITLNVTPATRDDWADLIKLTFDILRSGTPAGAALTVVGLLATEAIENWLVERDLLPPRPSCSASAGCIYRLAGELMNEALGGPFELLIRPRVGGQQ